MNCADSGQLLVHTSLSILIHGDFCMEMGVEMKLLELLSRCISGLIPGCGFLPVLLGGWREGEEDTQSCPMFGTSLKDHEYVYRVMA